MKQECTVTNSNKIIVCREKRSVLSVYNKARVKVSKITVDGCQLDDNDVKCDYLLLTDNIECYVELKGQDIQHALKQLERTIKDLSSDSRRSKKISFIVCSRSPSNSASIMNFRVKMKQKFNSDLIVKSSPCEFTLPT